METLTDVKLQITSDAFEEGGRIPEEYTCNGNDINPPLNIEHIPDETECLALMIEDPDAPAGVFVHWMVWDIPRTNRIEENTVPGIQGNTSFGKSSYGGPCPPNGEHRYYFHVYALKEALHLVRGAGKKEFLSALEGKVLAKGELMGRYG